MSVASLVDRLASRTTQTLAAHVEAVDAAPADSKVNRYCSAGMCVTKDEKHDVGCENATAPAVAVEAMKAKYYDLIRGGDLYDKHREVYSAIVEGFTGSELDAACHAALTSQLAPAVAVEPMAKPNDDELLAAILDAGLCCTKEAEKDMRRVLTNFVRSRNLRSPPQPAPAVQELRMLTEDEVVDLAAAINAEDHLAFEAFFSRTTELTQRKFCEVHKLPLKATP